MTKEFLVILLSYLLDGLDKLADATATEVDDKGVEMGRIALKEGVLLDWLFGKASAPEGTLALDAGPTPEVLSVLQKNGISWDDFKPFADSLIASLRAAAIAFLLKKFGIG